MKIKTVTTRRALIMSMLSLLVCVSMLVGTTFAWFTDSVTSTGNKIIAGNLKVDLLMSDDEGKYASIAGEEAAIFGGENSLAAKNNAADTLWEPGKTQIVYLGVANKGNLDLKYNILLNVVDGGLIGSLEYAIIDGAKYDDITATSWAVLKADANAQTGDVAAGTTVAAPNGAINAGEDAVDYFALAIHMKEEAGNQYQGKDITIDVTVLATQLASESDSFDNLYDKDAAYAITVNTVEELKKAVSLEGVKVTMQSGTYGLTRNDVLELAEGTTLLIPADATITINNASGSGNIIGNNAGGAIINEGTLNITSTFLFNNSTDADAPVIVNNGGTLVLNNATVGYPAYVTGLTASTGAAVQNNGGTVTIESGSFDSKNVVFAADGEDAVININNAAVSTANGYHPEAITLFSATNGAKITVNKGNYGTSDDTTYVANVDADSMITLNVTGASATTALITPNSAVSGLVITGGYYYQDPTVHVDTATYKIEKVGSRYRVS